MGSPVESGPEVGVASLVGGIVQDARNLLGRRQVNGTPNQPSLAVKNMDLCGMIVGRTSPSPEKVLHLWQIVYDGRHTNPTRACVKAFEPRIQRFRCIVHRIDTK